MNFENLGKRASTTESMSRRIIKGRVLQYDADFACYNVSDLDEPASKSFKRLLDHLEMKRVQAGAELVNAHITLGMKSGREEMATRKEYQENRDPDKPIKVRVRELRNMLANYAPTDTMRPVFNPLYEADDMMCIMQNEAIKKHGIESSVIMSGDKDLWMVQGYHCDDNSGRIYLVDGFGKTMYKEVGNVKPKLVGEGTSWFWHQMIMGDKADNIPGLEKISNKTLDIYTPLKTGKARKEGSGTCGEAKAVLMLDGVTNDLEAARIVFKAYLEYYGNEAEPAFMEQAYLLWMQRTYESYDVQRFLESIGMPLKFTSKQMKVISEFNQKKVQVDEVFR